MFITYYIHIQIYVVIIINYQLSFITFYFVQLLTFSSWSIIKTLHLSFNFQILSIVKALKRVRQLLDQSSINNRSSEIDKKQSVYAKNSQRIMLIINCSNKTLSCKIWNFKSTLERIDYSNRHFNQKIKWVHTNCINSIKK